MLRVSRVMFREASKPVASAGIGSMLQRPVVLSMAYCTPEAGKHRAFTDDVVRHREGGRGRPGFDAVYGGGRDLN